MTESEYHKLSSREKDCVIAKEIFGWKNIKPACEDFRTQVYWDFIGESPNGNESLIPAYTSNITLAWGLAIKMNTGRTGGFCLESAVNNETWWCGFLEPKDVLANADTAPEAIALASLKALGVVE